MIPLKDDAPRYSVPAVTWFLIALNVVVFLFEITLPVGERYQFLGQFGVTPAAFTQGAHAVPYATLVSSMFLHASFLHLLFNMWALWIFGDNVEDHLGHFRYLAFYFVCGVAASALQIALQPNARIPSVGASGAIAGVMGAYFALFPAARVLTYFFIFVMWVPAWMVLGYWFVVQFLSGAATSIAQASTPAGPGIAFWAHVGGFVSGLILARFVPQRHTHFRLQH